jgi:dipeptidyl-peptidase 4
MHKLFAFRTAILLAVLAPCVLYAQGTKEDYERSAKLFDLARGKVTNLQFDPVWHNGGKHLSFRREQPDGKKVTVLVEVATGREAIVEADKLPKAEPEKKEQKRPRREDRRQGPDSPDGKWSVVLKDHNVWLKDRNGDRLVSLSKEGKAEDGYTGPIFWSPNSKKVVVIRRTSGGDRRITLVESSPKDQLQPKKKELLYLKPGDPVPQPKPHLFDVETKKEIPISDELFANPWDVSYERWSSDGERFYFLYNQRGHQAIRLLSVEAKTGKVTPIIREECATFFDYAHKLYLNYINEDQLIWMSERDGWNHLYLIETKTGKVLNPITSGQWVVRRIQRVDMAKREILFWASGINPQEDPYHQHLCRVQFDGKGFVKLTEGDGTHTVEFSPDNSHFIDTYSRVDFAPVRELRKSSDGSKVCELNRSDFTAWKKAGWQVPERFVSKARDGKTDIWGVIVRPMNFDPKKKYPVIEYIYAGPQGHFVPKNFRTVHNHLNTMAELGFILVMIDGMGTNWRSKAFHDVCWKNLGDSGFPDRIGWIKAAAQKEPAMDLSRVGIFGGSAGGQSSTRALLAHGDFYKVAVSDCGCHDNRMDKVWWNELWMSWPIGPHYAEQSNVTQAHKLSGKLMLVVGELDNNVDPASTMQVANALIKANKDFELLIMPGVGHGAAETPYASRRRADFFVRHLLGVEPRR